MSWNTLSKTWASTSRVSPRTLTAPCGPKGSPFSCRSSAKPWSPVGAAPFSTPPTTPSSTRRKLRCSTISLLGTGTLLFSFRFVDPVSRISGPSRSTSGAASSVSRSSAVLPRSTRYWFGKPPYSSIRTRRPKRSLLSRSVVYRDANETFFFFWGGGYLKKTWPKKKQWQLFFFIIYYYFFFFLQH